MADIATAPQLGVATAEDSISTVDASAAAGSRLRRTLFSGSADEFLNGQGEFSAPVVYPADSTKFLDGDGNWTVPPGSSVSQITAVYPGTGLSGGGTSGDLVLSLSTAYQDAITANSAKVSFDETVVLTKTNTEEYTPTEDYHPSTRKFVLDSIVAGTAGVASATAGEGIVISAATGDVTFSLTATYQGYITANNAKVSFDSASSAKLATIAEGAEVNVQSDWTATTGDSFIANKPTAMPNFVITANKAAGYVVGTDDIRECYGGVIYVTNTAVITAPAVGEGMNFTIITVGNVSVHADVNIADKMYLDGILLADGKKALNTSTNQDMITFTYFSADGWYALSGTSSGDSWTAEA